MALNMARPFKHPKTGVYWFRKAVPADLREALGGRREFKRTLKTKDPAKARERFAVMAADIAVEWAQLKDCPAPLPYKTIVALAGDVYREVVGVSPEEPGDPEAWTMIIAGAEARGPEAQERRDASPFQSLAIGPTPMEKLEIALGTLVDRVLQRRGLKADAPSRTRLLIEANKAILQAAHQRRREAKGDFRPDPHAGRFPPVSILQPAEAAPEVRISSLVTGWAGEAKPVASTLRTWTGYVNEFIAHVGHDDAKRVTKADVVRWKNSLVAAGKLSEKSINQGRLAALSRAFAWGNANLLVPENPAYRVKVAAKKGQKSPVRGFSDQEAVTILRAARTQTKRSLRWLPWLAALCGGRIAELANVRGVDLTEAGGLWVLHISPDAGPLKNSWSKRRIPLHPALVTEGFPAAVRAAGMDAFFTDLFLREGNRGTAAAHVVGRWIRNEVGLKDPALAPNHSWRHRFRTLGHRYGMSEAAIDAVEGHAPKTQGQKYGERPIELLRELEKLPHPLGEAIPA